MSVLCLQIRLLPFLIWINTLSEQSFLYWECWFNSFLKFKDNTYIDKLYIFRTSTSRSPHCCYLKWVCACCVFKCKPSQCFLRSTDLLVILNSQFYTFDQILVHSWLKKCGNSRGVVFQIHIHALVDCAFLTRLCICECNLQSLTHILEKPFGPHFHLSLHPSSHPSIDPSSVLFPLPRLPLLGSQALLSCTN